MKKHRITSIIVAAAVAAGGVTGVAAAVRYTTGNQTVTVVPASELDYGWGGSSENMTGYVSPDASQSVYLSENETVSKVLVKEGDHVKKGDVLLTYDMRKTNLNLESERIGLEKTRLQIRIAEENLKMLKKKKPVLEPTGTPEEPGDTGDPEEPDGTEEGDIEEPGGTEEPEETPEEPNGTEEPETPEEPQPTGTPEEPEIPEGPQYGEVILNEKLDGNASCFCNHTSAAEPGSEANPYRFLTKDGARADASFLKKIRSLDAAENGDQYFEVEIRKGDLPTGGLIRAWMQNGADLDPEQAGENWSAVLDADEKTSFIIPGTEDGKDPVEDTGNDTNQSGKSSGDSEEKKDEGSPDQKDADSKTDGNDSGNSSRESGRDSGAGNADAAENGSGSGTSADTAEEEGTVKKQAVSGETASGITSVRTSSGSGEDSSGSSTDAADWSDSDTSGNGGSGSDSGLIPADTDYTEEELKQAKKEQSDSLADLKLDEREGVLKVYLAEKALNDGDVRAITDGIVKKVSDPKDPPTDGTAFLEISGSEGLTVHGGISERKLDQIHTGDPVVVMSWDSGESYSAKIASISGYPDMTGNFNDGSYATSYYPFTAILDNPDADLDPDSWVDITMDSDETGDETEETEEGSETGDGESVRTESVTAASGVEDSWPESVTGDENVTAASGVEDSGPESMTEDESVTAASSLETGSDEPISLMKAFVRTDDGDPYVYARGKDGRLEKRNVQIVKKDAYSLAVLGVSYDDWLAFPYGKQVREGARTKEGSTDELYS